jgi:magnesium chelatase family protein
LRHLRPAIATALNSEGKRTTAPAAALAAAITVLACLRTATVLGVEAVPVLVEVDVSFGLPQFTMVGLPDASVRESRDRVRSAIRNCGYEFPMERVTVNLAPADVRKAGTAFDLPIALGILAASGQVDRRAAPDLVLLGELSLDGGIHASRGVLPIAAAARRAGLRGVLVPAPNAAEATVVGGLDVYPVTTLGEAVAVLTAGTAPAAARCAPSAHAAGGPDLADVRGQALSRRAVEIAAAGGHHVLLVGPPGAGKTMIARRIPSILPPMTFEEALESSAIHSVAGTLPPGSGLLGARPFRAPHHTASDVALAGGGSSPRPGEISLAHNGVLFLDEMPEFNRRTLEVLRQPLETGTMAIARAARSVVFPARFVLVGAMNPCPCGFLGHPARRCRCTPLQVARYAGRLSGPLRDRIDLLVDVPAVPVSDLATAPTGEPSSAVAARVVGARAVQAARSAATGKRVNAELEGRALRDACGLSHDASGMLADASSRLLLSARAHDRVLKVARTIADLGGSARIEGEHVAEALQFRGDAVP